MLTFTQLLLLILIILVTAQFTSYLLTAKASQPKQQSPPLVRQPPPPAKLYTHLKALPPVNCKVLAFKPKLHYNSVIKRNSKKEQ
jgi:hypothetical protein